MSYRASCSHGNETDVSGDILIFQSHASLSDLSQGIRRLQARGGRVISVCGIGTTRDIAAQRAYSGMACVNLAGIDYRHDLGT